MRDFNYTVRIGSKRPAKFGCVYIGEMRFAWKVLTFVCAEKQVALPRSVRDWGCISVACSLHGMYRANTHGPPSPVKEKGRTVRPLSQEKSAPPLPWQAFIVILGTLHQGWSSFTMHGFVLGGYLLQTKERMSLNTSKKDICNIKGEVVKPVMLHSWKV